MEKTREHPRSVPATGKLTADPLSMVGVGAGAISPPCPDARTANAEITTKENRALEKVKRAILREN